MGESRMCRQSHPIFGGDKVCHARNMSPSQVSVESLGPDMLSTLLFQCRLGCCNEGHACTKMLARVLRG